MAGGYTVPDLDVVEQLMSAIRKVQRDIRELAMPTGSEIADSLATLQALVDGLLTQVNGIYSGYVQAGGNITSTAGTGSFAVGLTSPGVYTTDITLLPGARTSAWVHNTGVLGQTISSITKKTNLQQVPFTASQFLSVLPFIYEYKGQVDIRDNPENEYYDPKYVVPHEVGMMAEHLIDAGLEIFVEYDEDSQPNGIRYELFGAVAALVIGADHEERLKKLEAQGLKA